MEIAYYTRNIFNFRLKLNIYFISSFYPHYMSNKILKSRFIDNKDGTVLDTETNLVWMKEDDGYRRNHKDAMAYCKKNLAKLPGKGWYLPTRKELASLVDDTKYDPAIDPIFTNTKSAYYWSSTPHAYHPDCAWGVGFGNGDVSHWYTYYECYVLPVRQNS